MKSLGTHAVGVRELCIMQYLTWEKSSRGTLETLKKVACL